MSLNKMIDHTLLAANATREQIARLCDEAVEHGFASVCVNSCWVGECASRLAETDVNVCTVIGFPLGAMSTAGKAAETEAAVSDGANELDMVINVGWLLAGEDGLVRRDIEAVLAAAQGRCVKVIIETCLLSDEQIVRACEIAVEAGASFVKTSTGFSTGGATVEGVALMADARSRRPAAFTQQPRLRPWSPREPPASAPPAAWPSSAPDAGDVANYLVKGTLVVPKIGDVFVFAQKRTRPQFACRGCRW